MGHRKNTIATWFQLFSQIPTVLSRWETRSRWGIRSLLYTVAIALLYIFSAWLGLQFETFSGGISPIWPSTGVFIALLLLLGYSAVPGLILGGLLANWIAVQRFVPPLAFVPATGIILLMTLVTTLEPIISVVLIRRFIPLRKVLSRVKAVGRFIIFLMVGPLVAAVLGTLLLVQFGVTPKADITSAIWTWWLSGSVSGILLAPPILTWGAWLNQRLPTPQPVSEGLPTPAATSPSQTAPQLLSHQLFLKGVELVLGLLATLVISAVSFLAGHHLEYLLLPLVVWLTLRFGLRLVTLLILGIAGISILGTIQNLSSFASQPPNEALVLAQLFLGVLSITTLVLAATLEEKAEVQQQLSAAYKELDWKIQERTTALQQANHDLRWEIIERQRAETALQELNLDLESQVHDRTQQLQRTLDFEALLRGITDRIRDSLEESQILEAAVSQLAEVLTLECCNAGFYSASRDTVTISYSYTRPGWPNIRGTVIQIQGTNDEIHRFIWQGQCVQFCSVIRTFDQPQAAILACPIVDDQGVLGDLWLSRQPEQCFEDVEVLLVRQVANQCAIAIRQARLYQAAQSQVAELEQLNRLKDDFLSTVSHELRTPITSMKMAIQMLGISLDREVNLKVELEKADADQSRTARYFKILSQECDREMQLVNDLLDLQRLEVSEPNIIPETLCLQDWTPKLLKIFEARVHTHQQILKIEIDPDLPPLVSDRTSLERILIELLTNACKYTPAGEVIRLKIQKVDGQFQLCVCNSGIEIPPHELLRIFDKFYRIPKTDPWKQGGTGLGLALVQQLVKQLGGSIHVSSANNQTCFTVILPSQTKSTVASVKSI